MASLESRHPDARLCWLSFCNEPDGAKSKSGIAHFLLDFKRSSEPRYCRICCEECPAATVISLGCGHFFCRTCFTNYLVSKVSARKRSSLKGLFPDAFLPETES